jgi:hypothetical protein
MPEGLIVITQQGKLPMDDSNSRSNQIEMLCHLPEDFRVRQKVLCTEKIKPVARGMHYAFIERIQDPAVWFRTPERNFFLEFFDNCLRPVSRSPIDNDKLLFKEGLRYRALDGLFRVSAALNTGTITEISISES